METTAQKIITRLRCIIALSEHLSQNARWWYAETHPPLPRAESAWWGIENGITLPEEYLVCLSLTNGFTVDYASTVGWFHLEPFHTDGGLERHFTDERIRMLKKHIPFKAPIGWINHQCIYYDVFTGELFLEHKRYHYTPIRDFASEILDRVITHLEEQRALDLRTQTLLAQNQDNPLRPLYDQLLAYAGDGALPKHNIVLPPPASEEEVAAWEAENGISLPEGYRDWLLLANGGEFANKFILPLRSLRKAYPSETIGDTEYIYLAGLTGCFDYLMLNASTGEYAVFTEEFELEEAADFETEVLLDAFEYFDEHEEEDEA